MSEVPQDCGQEPGDMSLLNKRVRITDPHRSYYYGRICTIYRILPSRPAPYHVGTGGGDPDGVALKRNEFEVIE